jgi:predicted nuclease of restriction endonuclease-like (RecB) superfamily
MSGNRDIRNHYLFEIATEVANRGNYDQKTQEDDLWACRTNGLTFSLKLVESTQSSNRKLQSQPQNMATDTLLSVLSTDNPYVLETLNFVC